MGHVAVRRLGRVGGPILTMSEQAVIAHTISFAISSLSLRITVRGTDSASSVRLPSPGHRSRKHGRDKSAILELDSSLAASSLCPAKWRRQPQWCVGCLKSLYTSCVIARGI